MRKEAPVCPGPFVCVLHKNHTVAYLQQIMFYIIVLQMDTQKWPI